MFIHFFQYIYITLFWSEKGKETWFLLQNKNYTEGFEVKNDDTTMKKNSFDR